MKATVQWTGNVSFKAESETGHTVQMDGPADQGGENLGHRTRRGRMVEEETGWHGSEIGEHVGRRRVRGHQGQDRRGDRGQQAGCVEDQDDSTKTSRRTLGL